MRDLAMVPASAGLVYLDMLSLGLSWVDAVAQARAAAAEAAAAQGAAVQQPAWQRPPAGQQQRKAAGSGQPPAKAPLPGDGLLPRHPGSRSNDDGGSRQREAAAGHRQQRAGQQAGDGSDDELSAQRTGAASAAAAAGGAAGLLGAVGGAAQPEGRPLLPAEVCGSGVAMCPTWRWTPAACAAPHLPTWATRWQLVSRQTASRASPARPLGDGAAAAGVLPSVHKGMLSLLEAGRGEGAPADQPLCAGDARVPEKQVPPHAGDLEAPVPEVRGRRAGRWRCRGPQVGAVSALGARRSCSRDRRGVLHSRAAPDCGMFNYHPAAAAGGPQAGTACMHCRCTCLRM